MQRREFITLIGGAAATWPIAARAQQGRLRRIGALKDSEPSDPDALADYAAFEDALKNLGWIVGRNIIIDYRFSGRSPERIGALADELLKMTPDVVLTAGTAAAMALREKTQTVPVIFARVSDPVSRGLVANVKRPGGNVTGFSNFELTMGGKWLETLKEIAPKIARVTVIANPKSSQIDFFYPSVVAASNVLGIEAVKASVHDLRDVESAMAKAADKPDAGLIFLPDGFTIGNRDAIVARANELRLPAIYAFRFFAIAGGLVSYGIRTTDQFRGAVT